MVLLQNSRRDGLLFLILGSVIFVLLGIAIEASSPATMGDFRTQYYPARCLIQGGDPYNEGDVFSVYRATPGEPLAAISSASRFLTTRYIYPPTAFPLTIPFAILPIRAARALWMAASSIVLLIAGYLIWDIGSVYAPLLSGVLTGALLSNSELIISNGNVAGIVAGVCVIAVWCFLNDKLIGVGIVCLSFALLVKPHDSGFVWLFFLLSPGRYRKHALQTLAVTVAIGLPVILWVSHRSPNWIQEMQTNVNIISAYAGGLAPETGTPLRPQMMLNLQTIIGFFSSNPHVYNSVTYFICGVMLLAWTIATFRQQPSRANHLLGLASIAALTMLPVYHRECDGKLLLLAIPACAMLWAEGGRVGRLAVVITSIALFVTADIPWAIDIGLLNHVHHQAAGISGAALSALQVFPAPVSLLATALFFLLVYIRRTSGDVDNIPVPRTTQAV